MIVGPMALLLTAWLLPSRASGDIYSHIDEDGVVHFTNAPRPGRRWKRIMRTGPGKARVVHARRRRALSPRRYTRYDALIEEAADLYKIPRSLIRAVIRVESDYDERAVSRVGARGLMQLMPNTAREMGVESIFDPRQNIMGGTRLLRVYANRFAGDLELTLAAYHAGAGAVLKYKRTIPPYATTRAYVPLVLKHYRRYREASRKKAARSQRADTSASNN